MEFNSSKETFYAVLRLATEVDMKNPLNGETTTYKIEGLAGFIPVFSTIEEAYKNCEDGKYQIVPIQGANL